MSTPSAPTRISHVGIVAKSHLRAATPHLVGIGAWLRERDIEAIFESATAALMPSSEGLPRRGEDSSSSTRST